MPDIPVGMGEGALDRYRGSSSSFRRVQRVVHDLLGFNNDGVEVSLILEALRVDLADILRAGGPGRKPAAGGYDLQALDRGVVARRAGQLGGNPLSGQVRLLEGLGRQCKMNKTATVLLM
jgi:hypothetical protein